jgi:hypothetical protein
MSFVEGRAITTVSSSHGPRIANLEGVSMVSKARARADPARRQL